MSKIGFIGLGNMGLPMAANLVKAGHDVKGFDTVTEACKKAAIAGIKIQDSAAQTAKDVEYIITMLPSGAIMLSVFAEVIPAASPGTTIIDCSTVDVSSALKAHQLTEDASLNCLDSPVSGGITGAEAGTLTLMVGGEVETFKNAKNILDVVGSKLIHCGKGGTGQSAKICNNMLLGITMIGLGEIIVLAEKLGLDHQTLFDVVSNSSGSCWSLNSYCPIAGIGSPSPADNGFKPGFAAALMLKDLKLSQQAADETQTATLMGNNATKFYQHFVDEGFADLDFSAVVNQIRELQ